jgi:hypothetical protein
MTVFPHGNLGAPPISEVEKGGGKVQTVLFMLITAFPYTVQYWRMARWVYAKQPIQEQVAAVYNLSMLYDIYGTARTHLTVSMVSLVGLGYELQITNYKNVRKDCSNITSVGAQGASLYTVIIWCCAVTNISGNKILEIIFSIRFLQTFFQEQILQTKT